MNVISTLNQTNVIYSHIHVHVYIDIAQGHIVPLLLMTYLHQIHLIYIIYE